MQKKSKRRPSMFDNYIKKMEALDPEQERKCLERFLLAWTTVVRILSNKHPDSRTRMRILYQTNEINHRILNRVMALQGGDQFFTVSYTWRAVHDHVNTAPEFKEWVTGFLEGLLKDIDA